MAVKIKQKAPPAPEVPTEVIADAIVSMAEGVAKLRAGRLNEKALLLLIQHACPVRDRPTTKQIASVLDSIEALKRTYLKKVA